MGRVLREAEVGRLNVFDVCLLLALALRLGPIWWLDDVGSPFVLALTFELLGPAPEFGATPETMRLARGDCGDIWEVTSLARGATSAGVAHVDKVYGCCR